MKNNTKIILLLLTVVICLSSCYFGQSVTEAEAAINDVSDMIANGFEAYTLTITVTSPSGQTQKETYKVRTEGSQKVADYTIELPGKFEIIDGEVIAPDEYISTSIGQSTQYGDKAFAVPEFDFSSNAIKNLSYANGIILGNITSFEAFFGSSAVSGKNGRFAISYTGSNIGYIAIYYTSANGNSVTLKYTF